MKRDLVALALLAVLGFAMPASAQQKPLGAGEAAAQPSATVQLQLQNRLGLPVDYYVVDPQSGAYRFYATIPAGGAMVQPSRPGLVWVFGQNKKPIQRYTTGPAAVQTVAIGTTTPAQAATPARLAPPKVLARGRLDDPAKQRTDAGAAAQRDAGAGASFPAAASWGGVLRAGPSADSRRLASLKERDPIQILERTDVVFNGYPWFRVKTRAGTGYHWGGIICGRTQPIGGAFEICR